MAKSRQISPALGCIKEVVSFDGRWEVVGKVEDEVGKGVTRAA